MIDKKLCLPKYRVSNPISKLLRPIFEAKKAKEVFGGFLAVSSLILAFVAYPLAKYTPASALEATAIPMVEFNTTESGIKLTVPDQTGISQGYWVEHPGLDITAPLGSIIRPVKAGVVTNVSISKFNYGRSVTVTHEDGSTSLYAHMGKVFVYEGDEVTVESSLGEVGMSGRTTGPHLHLEIRVKNINRNPLAYLR